MNSILFCLTLAALAKAMPSYDYGGKSPQQFLTSALERSSPSSARLLAELFGGIELGLDLGGGTQAIISVGGAATQCQHQSPCYDSHCKLCYDPLLRIHGKCGGASYFTCRGTLPKGCLPFTCTARSGRQLFQPQAEGESAVFVKTFRRYRDPFCLDAASKQPRSLQASEIMGREGGARGKGQMNKKNPEDEAITSLDYHPRDKAGRDLDLDKQPWVMTVPEAITPCQSFDLCIDLRCGLCYDPYLGAHTSCGKMTYYDCEVNLPKECRPLKCSETNIKELFPVGLNKNGNIKDPKKPSNSNNDNKDEQSVGTSAPLMVRSFQPLSQGTRNCF